MLVSFNDGMSWQSLQLNLPVTQVSGIALKDDDMVIATHGRSYYVLDNITPLRQVSADMAQKSAVLYKPSRFVRTLSRPSGTYNRTRQFIPEFDYYLGRDADSVTLEILDAQGRVINTFAGSSRTAAPSGEAAGGGRRGVFGSASLPVKAGHHRFRWDMRYPGPRDFPGLIMWAANTQGPLAPPGNYSVRFTALGETYTEPFTIVADPRLTNITQADFEAQFKLSSQVAARVDDAHRAVLQVRDVRGQVDDRLGKASGNRQLSTEANRFKERIATVEGDVYQVRMQASQDPLNYPIKLNNQLAALRGVIESADARPTAQSGEAFTVLSDLLEVQLTSLQKIFDEDLKKLNDRLKSLGLDPIVVPALTGTRVMF
jgi:hypothetical protein